MPKDALNTCVSLNMTVDDEEETEMVDIIADPATDIENVEEKIWHGQLRDAVDRERVRQLENKAIRKLREPKLSCRLRPFYDFNVYSGTGVAAFRRSGMSVQERYLIRQERKAATSGQ